MDLSHKENFDISPQYKFDRWMNLSVLIMFIIVVGFIAIFLPEFASEALTALLAAFGGYGFAKIEPKMNNQNQNSAE